LTVLSAKPSRRAATIALVGSFLLHTLAVLWAWRSWGTFGRGGVLAWIDFPSSLLYLHFQGGRLLAWSLAAGGLQWAAIGAALSLALGRSARPRGGSGGGAAAGAGGDA
jgi:hypothetical protein